MSFFAELKRRNVFRVGIAYAITAWLLIQVSDILLESIGAPSWVMLAMFIVLAAGFVVALFFAWAFELTPEGVKKEKDVDRDASIAPRTGQKLNLGIVALLVVTLAYVAYDKLVLDGLLETGPVTNAQPGSAQPGSDPFSQQTAGKTNAAGEKRALTPVEAIAQAEAPTTQKSIVVLPFINMSNDPEQEFFSDGLIRRTTKRTGPDQGPARHLAYLGFRFQRQGPRHSHHRCAAQCHPCTRRQRAQGRR